MGWVKLVTPKIYSIPPKRLAYSLAMLGFGVVPVHPWVSCELSGAILGCTFMGMIAVFVLCRWKVPRSDSKRWLPLGLAFAAYALNSTFAH